MPGLQGTIIDAFPASVIFLSLLALAADLRLGHCMIRTT